MIELKEIEKSILTSMLFSSESRFKDLNIYKLSTDKFNYHLKNVMNLGLIAKNSNNNYELTSTGIKYVSQIDGFKKNIDTQMPTIVLAVCRRENEGKREFLIHKRLKHPMRNFNSFPGGRKNEGETLEDAVKRELQEETGLYGYPKLKCITHTIKKCVNDSFVYLLDNINFVYLFDNPEGNLINTPEGENDWLTIDQIKSRVNIFKDTLDIIYKIDDTQLRFYENFEEYTVS